MNCGNNTNIEKKRVRIKREKKRKMEISIILFSLFSLFEFYFNFFMGWKELEKWIIISMISFFFIRVAIRNICSQLRNLFMLVIHNHTKSYNILKFPEKPPFFDFIHFLLHFVLLSRFSSLFSTIKKRERREKKYLRAFLTIYLSNFPSFLLIFFVLCFI